MNEALLQFIWQHSLYQAVNLHASNGDPLVVVHPGRLNRDAGPDFEEGKIRIGGALWVGNIELHVRSSDWRQHGHTGNPAYNNLVLHVVYEDDDPGIAGNIPVLVLKSRIDENILRKYSLLMQAPYRLPCGDQHKNVREITREGWLNRLLAERWEQKLADWTVLLENSAGDWRNLLYWRLAANFGFKTNAAPFLMLAQSLPLNVPARHRDSLLQTEALLFGQAGMLENDFKDDYPRELQREYDYLRKKYKLKPIQGHLWKFLRMRPANFPTIRIAQFAGLIHKSIHLFAQVVETRKVSDIVPLLDIAASSYWDTHFQFDGTAHKSAPKSLGKNSMYNVVINTIAPIQFLYAARHDTYLRQEQALQLLEDIPAEKNSITAIWEHNGWHPRHAGQSQALIQLYNQYCSQKRCLDCAIGLQILSRDN